MIMSDVTCSDTDHYCGVKGYQIDAIGESTGPKHLFIRMETVNGAMLFFLKLKISISSF